MKRVDPTQESFDADISEALSAERRRLLQEAAEDHIADNGTSEASRQAFLHMLRREPQLRETMIAEWFEQNYADVRREVRERRRKKLY